MLVRERERSGTLTDFSVCFELLLTYRVPMKVDEVVVFFPWNQEDIYYRCPRCQNLLDREFMDYCSCCGQCLDWRGYRKARRIRRESPK